MTYFVEIVCFFHVFLSKNVNMYKTFTTSYLFIYINSFEMRKIERKEEDICMKYILKTCIFTYFMILEIYVY